MLLVVFIVVYDVGGVLEEEEEGSCSRSET